MIVRPVIVEPTLTLKKTCEYTGQVVRVVSGAWPSLRIYFQDPGTEGVPGEVGMPVVNGECYFPRNTDTFDRFYLRGQTLQAPNSTGDGQERLVLEVFDCVQPVHVLNHGRGAGWKFHYIAGGNSLVEIVPAATSVLYADNQWGATGIIDDPKSFDYVPRGYIGGGITANQSFNVYILQHLTKNATRKCELARWKADALSIVPGDGYGVSFEMDGQPKVSSVKSVAQSGATLLPWPLFGMTIVVEAIGDITDLQWLLYSRGALS